MTPEEKFNQQVWEILQDIKEETLATQNDKPVKYKMPHVAGAGIIPRDRREGIIFKLQELGALRVRESPFEPPVSTNDVLYLDIYPSTFETVYTKYQKICDVTTYLNEYQRNIYEGKENPPEFSQLDNPVSEVSLLVEQIDAIYKRVKETAEPKFFFSNLFEYVDGYFREGLLRGVVRALNDLGNTETTKLKQLEKLAYSEIDKAFQKLSVYCSKAGIKNAIITGAIKNYHSYEKGTIESTEGPLSGRIGEVEDIIRGLVATKNTEHLKIAQQYAELTPDGFVRKYIFSPSYEGHKQEKLKQERLRETRPWFSWDKLFTFHRLYIDHESVYKQYMESGKPLTALSAGMLSDELNTILTKPHDPNHYIREFHVETYKNYMERVHLYAKELLLKFDEHERKQVPDESTIKQPTVVESSSDTWSFDTRTNTLTVANKTIKLKSNTNRTELLKILSKNKNIAKQEWQSVELYEAISGSNDYDTKQAQRKIYYLCRDLNAVIASKTGKQNFFIYSMMTVNINSDFLFHKK
ncbi:MAG: hypothetical protein UY13_C0002G0124 [Candidatus Pacebacteria bacterium GW2011_GWB1_47_8]|nr:MAG: hypothetical protein UX28_C0001G0273 [Candidatus Pacebacteria bacterium GW2011_GWA1_46_10]KKU84212.1 MAG: hypothetical protein UY13_C0002G0124 [Candidatus Pacebacteria bacterium GW2011_GWB1_47_8]HCR81338.1 hypothetical protein [Candidatus Paceibacterota bacterium]